MSATTEFSIPREELGSITTPTQGVTFALRISTTMPDYYLVTAPNGYDGRTNPSSIGLNRTTSNIHYNPNLWTLVTRVGQGPLYNLTTQVVNGVFTSTGSLDITFTDSNSNPIEKFVDIPGHLDTFKLNNGGYANAGVEGIFIQLKKYLYIETIFNDILNKLSEFFTSEGFKQGVTESIEYLNSQFIAGKITIDQFNELVTKSEEELASQYGDNYVKNYIAVNAAIHKYKPLLEN